MDSGLSKLILEMLVILHSAPRATPCKTILNEQLITQIASGDFIWEVGFAVTILYGSCWFYYASAVFLAISDVGIVECVDVDSQSTGVFRQIGRARHIAVAEATGIVVAHLSLIVSIVVVGQSHTLDRVVGGIKFAEDSQQFVGYQLVANHLAHMYAPLKIVVRYAQVSQVAATDIRIVVPGLALHG